MPYYTKTSQQWAKSLVEHGTSSAWSLPLSPDPSPSAAPRMTASSGGALAHPEGAPYDWPRRRGRPVPPGSR